MELLHFSHKEHPLIFRQIVKPESKIWCPGCGHQISGPHYRCTHRCWFFLHKHCAELSGEIKHPLHQDHTLTPFSNPPETTTSPDKLKTCNLCHETLTGFTYICSSCNDFAIDLVCALRSTNVNHRSHHHPLTPLQKPATFFCHGCRRQHKGISYLCTSCQFWVHQECAWAPSSLRCFDHDEHSLTLAYSLPENYSGCPVYCHICSNTIEDVDWAYYCDQCSNIAHFYCARSNEKPFNKKPKTKPGTDEIESELIQLPLPSQTSVNLITQFIKHSGHPHPLILSGDYNVKDGKCGKCEQPLSAPFYKCIQCEFSLHKDCKVLTKNLTHPCHPKKPLTLLDKSPKPCGIFQCKGCLLFSNLATYGCGKTKFYLDLSCASLPSKIKHQGHKHALTLEHLKSATPCSACNELFVGFGFRCEDPCTFTIEAYCAFLPAFLPPSAFERHYANERFVLTYSTIKDQGQYYCEVCEEKMHLKWCYYCAESDRVIHLQCIRHHLFDSYSNIKLGVTENVDSYGHKLTLIKDTEAEQGGDRCQVCGCGKSKNGLALTCTEANCGYMIHPECHPKPEKQKGGVKRKRK